MNNFTSFQLGSLLFVASSLAVGQLLFKVSAQSLVFGQGLPVLAKSFVTWQFMLAIGVYGFSTLLWVMVLNGLPLSRAYPFMAFGFAVVPVGAHFFFGESLNLRYWGGVILILFGLYLIAINQSVE